MSNFDVATENATVMASRSRAKILLNKYGTNTPSDVETTNECVEYLKNKYNRVFGKNTPSVAIKVYPFSNENVKGMFNHLDVKNKSVLVVGSSADQAIASIMGGAKSVALADKNPITRYFGQLKIAAISALSYKEFKEYFCNNILCMNLNIKYYKKFSHLLDQESRDFWDNLYMEYSGSEIASAIFHDNTINTDFIPYLQNEKEYQRTKEALQKTKINYVIDDVLNFHNHIGNLDIILLSNIVDYIDGKHDKEFGEELQKLKAKLNPGGVLQYEYTWGPKEYFENQTALTHAERRVASLKKYLKGGRIYEVALPPVHDMYTYLKHKATFYVKGKGTTKQSLLKTNDEIVM